MFLCLCFVLSTAAPALAADEAVTSGECGAEGGNVVWKLDGSTLVISGMGAMADYTGGSYAPWYDMRDSIDNVIIEDGVTTIGNFAFHSMDNLAIASIPDSITSIGTMAFCDCFSLKEIYLPGGLTAIGRLAFASTNLSSISIPSTVTEIDAAFSGCKNLSSLTVDSGNTAYTAVDNALFNTDQTELICYALGKSDTAYKIPSGVTVIKDYAFSGADHLSEVTIPISVSEIGFQAFEFCDNLTDIYYEGTRTQWTEINIRSAIGENVTIHYAGEDETVPLESGTKYVPYSAKIKFDGMEDAEYALTAGTLQFGLTLDTDGTIHGVPMGAGDFSFNVRAALDNHDFIGRQVDLTVAENTDANIAAAQEKGYDICTPIGENQGNGHYTLNGYKEQTFMSGGPFSEFVDLWLDGKKLTRDVEYKVEQGSAEFTPGDGDHTIAAEFVPRSTVIVVEGSTIIDGGTVITIPAEIFQEYDTGKGETHTIAAEFRTSNGLSYTVQNYVIEPGDSASTLPEGVKYVPYSCGLPAIEGYKPGDPELRIEYSVLSGVLPSGLTLNSKTGELSGVPLAYGTFEFSAMVEVYRVSDNERLAGTEGHYALTVLNNTNSAVVKPNDYPITDPVGIPDPNDPNHFYKYDYRDETLIIDGPYTEFMRLLIDGREKRRNIDYTAREGSTVITIFGETFEDTGSGTHTIAAEFREGGNPEGELKTVAQNYTIQMLSYPSNPGTGGTHTPSTKPETKPDTKPDTTTPVTPEPEKPQVSSFPFADVTPPDWFYDDVKWAYEEEVMTGETSTLFAPEKAISQATVVTVLARMAKADLEQFDGVTSQDVEPGQWYTNAAIWAKQAGLLPDYSTFTGTGPFSRGQMAVMLVKYLRSLGLKTSMPEAPLAFADGELMSAEENSAFQVLYHCGIFKGVGDLYMDPAGTTERAQFAALVHRISVFVQTH